MGFEKELTKIFEDKVNPHFERLWQAIKKMRDHSPGKETKANVLKCFKFTQKAYKNKQLPRDYAEEIVENLRDLLKASNKQIQINKQKRQQKQKMSKNERTDDPQKTGKNRALVGPVFDNYSDTIKTIKKNSGYMSGHDFGDVVRKLTYKIHNDEVLPQKYIKGLLDRLGDVADNYWSEKKGDPRQ
jgi:hypothetical protein